MQLRAAAAQKGKPKPRLPKIGEPSTDRFQIRRLMRVRKQLDMVDSAVDEALKPGGDLSNLKTLVDASWRLCEQEFALANRPKPANARPTQNRPAARTEPLE